MVKNAADEPHQYSRWPKIAVPTRTRLDPLATAMSRSSLMPMLRMSNPRSPSELSFLISLKHRAMVAKSSATRRVSSVFDAMPMMPHIWVACSDSNFLAAK